MAIFGIQLCDAGFEAAILDASGETQPVTPGENGGPLGWMGLAYHDGQKFWFGRKAEDVWYVHPRQICHRFWGRLSREPSTVAIAGKSQSFSQIAYYFFRDFQEKIAPAGAIDKVAIAVPGAYLKDEATEDERVGLLLGMASELKLPLVGLIDMACASLCDPRIDYYDPSLPVVVVDVHLHGAEITLVRHEDGRPARRDFAYLPQSGYAELLRHVTTAMGNRFLRHTTFDILEDGRIEQVFYRQCKDFLVSRANEQYFQINTANRNYELMVTRDQLAADTAAFTKALATGAQGLLHKAGGRFEPCTVALTERASLLPGLAGHFRAAGMPRIVRLPSGCAATGAALVAGTRDVPADLTDVPVDTSAPFAPERRAQRAAFTLRVVKGRKASNAPTPTHVICDGLGHVLNGHPGFTIGARGVGVDLPLPEEFAPVGGAAVVRLERDTGRWWLVGADETEGEERTAIDAGDRLLVRFGEAETEVLFAHCASRNG